MRCAGLNIAGYDVLLKIKIHNCQIAISGRRVNGLADFSSFYLLPHEHQISWNDYQKHDNYFSSGVYVALF